MQMEMRQVLHDGLKELMSKDQRIVVIEADLARANGTWDLRESYPERVFEAGVAEQHMMSMAAGMASYGLIAFCGSFTPFATRRACDQIAVSVCYANMNVKILGTDEGIAAEINGATHMSFEDISVVRAIPNLLIFSPADNEELRQALPAIAAYHGPCYIRMQRKVVPDIHGADYQFQLFNVDFVKRGTDVTIFSTGGIMPEEVCRAIELLEADGISSEYVNVHTLKPLDRNGILASLQKTGCAVTCDNHNVIGGLGSAIAELAAQECPVPVEMIGVQDQFGEVGRLPYLKEKFHMTANDIATAAKRAIARKAGSTLFHGLNRAEYRQRS